MKTKTLIKYTVKYFILLVIAAYSFQGGIYLVNQKDDFENILGCAVFTGLGLGGVIILSSDIKKNDKEIKKNNEKQTN